MGVTTAEESTASRMRQSRLTTRKQRFVEEYLTGADGATAARRAGYSARAARQIACKLLNTDAAVMEAVEKGRQMLTARHELTRDSMIAQLREDRQFAIHTHNATAAVRASELLAKLAGLLVERRDHRVLGAYKIVIAGLDHA